MKFRKHNERLQSPNWDKIGFARSYPAITLRGAILKCCARERFGTGPKTTFYYKRKRKSLNDLYESKYGPVPAAVKLKKLPMDPYYPSSDKEFRRWYRTP